MLKKTITYTDFDDNVRTEDHYFNISKTELMQMEIETPGGMSEMLKRIVAAQDLSQLAVIFKDFISKSYGEKSPDGKRFIKSKEISEAFCQTGAYDELYMSLLDATAAADFFNSIIPKTPKS